MKQLFSLVGKGGSVYKKHAGFCLETQIHPDAVNQEYSIIFPRDLQIRLQSAGLEPILNHIIRTMSAESCL